MFQTRIHGRGGQGVVTSAELLALAAFFEGRHAQAFPSFGSERTGAPVVSFCRVDDRPIRLREPIVEPDALVIQDPTLLHQVNLFSGVGPDACIVVNTARSFEELGLGELSGERRITVRATDIARAEIGRPLPGVPLLGAFAALTGLVSLDSLARAVGERFPAAVAAANMRAGRRAFDDVRASLGEPAHA